MGKRQRENPHIAPFSLLVILGLSIFGAFILIAPSIQSAHALTPSPVNKYSTSTICQYSNNAPIFAHGRYWVFYTGGASSIDLYVNSSADGVTFSTTAHLISTNAAGCEYSVFYSNTQAKFYYSSVAFNSTLGARQQYWGMGTLNSDGTVTMIVTDATVAVFSAAESGSPSIVLDGTGHLWISQTEAVSLRQVNVYHCSLSPASCTSKSNWKLSLQQGGTVPGSASYVSQLQTLTRNKVVLIWEQNTGVGNTYINTWNGTSWDTANNSQTGLTAITHAAPTLGDCSSIHDTLECSFPVSSVNLEFIQAIYNATSGHTVWQSPTSIFTSGTNMGATVHTDNSTNISIVFNDRGSSLLYCTYSTNNGSSFASNSNIGLVARLGVATNQPGQGTSLVLVALDNDTVNGVIFMPLRNCAQVIPNPPVTITVETNPLNLMNALIINGTKYSTTQTFVLTPGRPLNLTAATKVLGPGATLYSFSSWSDSGARSHVITVPSSNTTYIATFSASGGPGGTCPGTPFQELQEGCWLPAIVNWYSNGSSGLNGGIGLSYFLAIVIGDIDIALFLSTRSGLIAGTVFTVSVAILGFALPGVFPSLAYFTLIVMPAAIIYKAYTLRS